MKLLVHAINGIGLGHLVRTLEIAKALAVKIKDLEVVFVTNSAFSELIAREGYKVYRLRYQTKMVLDGEVSYEAYLQRNYLEIRGIIHHELPDVIVMDSEFNIRLVDHCCEKKIRTCFVLRSTTNEKIRDLCQKGAWDKVDLVLVPHLEQDISPVQKNMLLTHRNIHFVGPILKAAEKETKRKMDGIFRILITFSAGADIPGNKGLFSKVSGFLERLKAQRMRVGNKRVAVSIVVGPYFKRMTCDLHGFAYKEFEHDLPGALGGVDLVISPAGYNLVNEIIATKTPALFIPVATKEDTQRLRAGSLEDKGCAVIVDDEIWECLEEVIKKDKIKTMKSSFPEIVKGNGLAAEKIVQLMEEKPGVLFLRGHWLPVSERFIYDELCHLKQYKPSVMCLRHEYKFEQAFDLLFDEKFAALWSRTYPLTGKGQQRLHAEMLRWSAAEIRARRIDILHAEFLSDAVFFLKLKQLTEVPLVVSVRGHDLYSKGQAGLPAVIAVADMFLVRSEIMKQDMLSYGCPAEKILVHHSGIRLPREEVLKNNASREIRVLMAGRFVEKKGLLFGVDVFNKLCRKFNNLKLYIVGDGPLRSALIQVVSQSPYSSKIVWCGELQNKKVLELMNKCHVLFHPSITARDGDREGIPGVVMEAMAHGLVVVASDNGSIPEIVLPNKTGFLFRESDACQAAILMAEAIENNGKLDAMRAEAFNKVKNEFNIVTETERLEVVYDFILKSRRNSRYDRYYDNYKSVIKHDRPDFFRADIHPVRGCNSSCMACDHWKKKIVQVMSGKEIIDLIQGLKNIGAQEIRFHGQEPTLRKDLPVLIDHAKRLGLRVGLKTNCLGITREYCQRLSILDKLYVSIDAPVDSLHDQLKGRPGSLRNNIRVISWIREVRPDFIIESNAVVTRLNYKLLNQMPEFAYKHGISRVSFVLPNSRNRKDIQLLLMNREEMEDFFFHVVPGIIRECVKKNILFDFSPFFVDLVLEHPARIISALEDNPEKFREEISDYLQMHYGKKFHEKYGCHGPIDHVSVNYDGNVFPCCVIERDKQHSIGNITQDSFQHIWASEKYSGIRKNTAQARGRCCDHAAFCGSNFNARKALSERIRAEERPEELAALNYIGQMTDFFMMRRPDIDRVVRSTLKFVLLAAREDCAFYKRRLPVNIPSGNKLSLSGFLTKDDIRENIHKGMISRKYIEHPGLILDRTSGSAGDAVGFAYLRGAGRYTRMVYPFMINAGWKWGDRYCVLTTLHCSRERCSTDNLPYYVNRVKIPAADDIFTNKAILKQAHDILRVNQSSLVHADPFYLCAVAFYLNQNGLKLALKGISSTYELLIPYVRRYLEKTFGCQVFDNYGCSEFGPIAFSCEKGRKHVFENAVVVEIVDQGQHLDPDVGEVVITSMDNPAMPLIRYRTGDLGKLIEDVCACHRTARAIEIYGRKDCCVPLKGALYTEKDIAGLLDIPGVLLYQLIQNSTGFSCDILLENGYEGRVRQDKVVQEIRRRFVDNDMRVMFVNGFKPEASGKFRTVIPAVLSRPNDQ